MENDQALNDKPISAGTNVAAVLPKCALFYGLLKKRIYLFSKNLTVYRRSS